MKNHLKRMIKNPVSLALLLSMLSFSPVDAATVAMVNQTPIALSSVHSSIQLYLKQIGHKKLPPLRMLSLQKEVLTKLIEEELLYQEGLQRGIEVSEEEIEAGIIQVQIRFSSTKAFNEALTKEGLNMAKIREGVQRSLIIQKVWKKYSRMNEKERSDQLHSLAEESDIRINEAPLRASRHH